MGLSWAGAMLHESRLLSVRGAWDDLAFWLGCPIRSYQRKYSLVTWMALAQELELMSNGYASGKTCILQCSHSFGGAHDFRTGQAKAG